MDFLKRFARNRGALIGLVLLLKWYGPGLVRALRTIVEEMLGPTSLSNMTPGEALLSLLMARDLGT